jgi:hypothetical protein
MKNLADTIALAAGGVQSRKGLNAFNKFTRKLQYYSKYPETLIRSGEPEKKQTLFDRVRQLKGK